MNVVKDTALKVRILPDADAVAREAAKVIAADARTAVTARGRFIVAVSGGHTPWQMLRQLANEDVQDFRTQELVGVYQQDERHNPLRHGAMPGADARSHRPVCGLHRGAGVWIGPQPFERLALGGRIFPTARLSG